MEGRDRMTYPSKIDWWVAAILVALSAVEIGVGAVVLSIPNLQVAPWPVLLVALLPLLIGGLLLWICFSTRYTVRPPNLVVRSGPLGCTIPLDAIAEVQARRGYHMEMGWNFALSLDRFFIKYRTPNGRQALFGVVISPKDKEGFLEELRREAPTNPFAIC
jgi:hypothetical protein